MILIPFNDTRIMFSLWLDTDLLNALKAISARDNRTVSSIIRDAIFTEVVNDGVDFFNSKV